MQKGGQGEGIKLVEPIIIATPSITTRRPLTHLLIARPSPTCRCSQDYRKLSKLRDLTYEDDLAESEGGNALRIPEMVFLKPIKH